MISAGMRNEVETTNGRAVWGISGERTGDMPMLDPVIHSGDRKKLPNFRPVKEFLWRISILRRLPVAFVTAAIFPQTAFAQSATGTNPFLEMVLAALESFQSFEILLVAIFGGAMSFAILSASWLIRERAKMAADNEDLKALIADLRVESDRNRAMVEIAGQLSIIWNGPNDTPSVKGEINAIAGMLDDPGQYSDFSRWIDPSFVPSLETRIMALRQSGSAFTSATKTRAGAVLEVTGATAGNYAIVRFSDLQGVQEELARLRVDHRSLRRSFEHVEHLLASAPLPAWLKKAHNQLSWVNKAYAQALDMDDPKVVVEQNLQLFDSEQRQLLDRSAVSGEIFDDVLPATIAGDRKKLRVLAIENETGGAGIAIDKSDVDEMNRLLKETNESHSRMLDQLATAVAIFDGSRRLAFYNSSFQRLWKFDPGLLEGNPGHGDVLDAMRDSKMLPEQPDWRKWRENQLGIYTAIEPEEEWWHLVDGQTLRVAASPRSQGGSTWIFENFTEKLALESNYNALMRVQGETLDHLNEAVAVFGSNGQLKLFNPALEALWEADGIKVQEGLHISTVVDGWALGAGNNEALQVLLGSITGFDDARDQIENRMQLSDGRTLHYAVVPLPDSQTMITFADVTASVNLEKALRERAEALEASDHLKSRFIQHVSYELRAPLTSISGFGEILKLGGVGALSPKQEEYVGHINSAAETLRQIVDDILDLASIDAGTMVLEYDAVNLRKTAARAFETFAGEMEHKGLGANIEIEPGSETIIADPDRLLQVLRNVVSNAINHSPDGGMITLMAQRMANMHEIRVMDQGPGIAANRVNQVFERFESDSTPSGKSGTGLGLSIVKGFLELHGGQVAIDTSSQSGTCLVCYLPVTPPNDFAPAAIGAA